MRIVKVASTPTGVLLRYRKENNMAFELSKERYASFGAATNLPNEIIDTFWDILDNYLKGVFKLDSILTFHLIEKNEKLTILYNSQNQQTSIEFDYDYPFDPFFPNIVYIIDQSGTERLLLPHELD